MASIVKINLRINCSKCHKTCDIIIEITDSINFCPYCGKDPIEDLIKDLPVDNFLLVGRRFLENNLPKQKSDYLKTVLNDDYMHNQIIKKAATFYRTTLLLKYGSAAIPVKKVSMDDIRIILRKIYNRYYNAHKNNMMPPYLRKMPDTEHYNFNFRLDNFVMKDLDVTNPAIDN
jgi:hypothetical protein